MSVNMEIVCLMPKKRYKISTAALDSIHLEINQTFI